MTSIEWTEQTWNPIAGCSVLSPGCKRCYAMKMARRLELMGSAVYAGLTQQTAAGPVWTGKIEVNENTMLAPLKRKKPTMYFVNSMSDLFHESVPDYVIDRVFAVMALCPQHIFQVLTKRSARMREYLCTRGGDWMIRWPDANPPGTLPISRHEQRLAMHGKGWPDAIIRPTFPLPNVWLGVSVEDQKRADERIPDLLATPAAVRFLSCEPLLGPVNLRRVRIAPNHHTMLDSLDGYAMVDTPGRERERTMIDWVIVGGESGPGARPMANEWAQAIVDQCQAASVPVFVKQLSSGGPKPIKDIEQFPEGLRVRQWPVVEERKG